MIPKKGGSGVISNQADPNCLIMLPNVFVSVKCGVQSGTEQLCNSINICLRNSEDFCGYYCTRNKEFRGRGSEKFFSLIYFRYYATLLLSYISRMLRKFCQTLNFRDMFILS